MLSNLALIAPLGDSELVLEMQKRRESRRLSKELKEADAKGPADAKEARCARAGRQSCLHRDCRKQKTLRNSLSEVLLMLFIQ